MLFFLLCDSCMWGVCIFCFRFGYDSWSWILTLFVRVVYLRNTFNYLHRIAIPMDFHSVIKKRKRKEKKIAWLEKPCELFFTKNLLQNLIFVLLLILGGKLNFCFIFLKVYFIHYKNGYLRKKIVDGARWQWTNQTLLS